MTLFSFSDKKLGTFVVIGRLSRMSRRSLSNGVQTLLSGPNLTLVGIKECDVMATSAWMLKKDPETKGLRNG